jgi:hypothetical protein
MITFVLFAASPALAHNRCACLSRTSGLVKTELTISLGYTAYRVVWNGRGLPGHADLNGSRRRGVSMIELVHLPQPRSGVRFRVPRVPPGTYPVVIYDGSEGGTHYVWELFRVGREAPSVSNSDGAWPDWTWFLIAMTALGLLAGLILRSPKHRSASRTRQ